MAISWALCAVTVLAFLAVAKGTLRSRQIAQKCRTYTNFITVVHIILNFHAHCKGCEMHEDIVQVEFE